MIAFTSADAALLSHKHGKIGTMIEDLPRDLEVSTDRPLRLRLTAEGVAAVILLKGGGQATREDQINCAELIRVYELQQQKSLLNDLWGREPTESEIAGLREAGYG